jgi:hypothetical protein
MKLANRGRGQPESPGGLAGSLNAKAPAIGVAPEGSFERWPYLQRHLHQPIVWHAMRSFSTVSTANMHALAYLCWEMTRNGALLTAVDSPAACLQVNCDLGVGSASGAMTSHTEQPHHDVCQKRVFDRRLLRRILLISVLRPICD